jgi:F-type H+-transporting ATPase subunit b
MADPIAHPSAAVAENLQAAATSQPLAKSDIRDGSGLKGTQSGTTAAGGPEHVADPVDNAIGFNSTGWVGVAALLVLVGMVLWKVPTAIAAMLDKRIAAVRAELDEAKRLRAEAEALRTEYEGRAKSAEADAAIMRSHARQEANAIIAKAKTDAEQLMTRRAKMAEDRIAAAEQSAVAEVRARAADAATRAAAALIAERHDTDADRAMVNRSIAGIGRLN